MKQLIAILLCLCLTLPLVACKSDSAVGNTNDTPHLATSDITEATTEATTISSEPTVSTEKTEDTDPQSVADIIHCNGKHYQRQEYYFMSTDEMSPFDNDNVPTRVEKLTKDRDFIGYLTITGQGRKSIYEGSEIFTADNGIYVVYPSAKALQNIGLTYAELWRECDAPATDALFGDVLPKADNRLQPSVITYNEKQYTLSYEIKLTRADYDTLENQIDNSLFINISGKYLIGNLTCQTHNISNEYVGAEVYANDDTDVIFVALTEPRANTPLNFTVGEYWICQPELEIDKDVIIATVDQDKNYSYTYISSHDEAESYLGPFILYNGKYYEYYTPWCSSFSVPRSSVDTDEYISKKLDYIKSRLIDNISLEYLGKNLDVAARLYGIEIPSTHAVLTTYDRPCDCDYYLTEYGLLEVFSSPIESKIGVNTYLTYARIWNEHNLAQRFEEIADGGPIDCITYGGEKYYDYAQIGRGVYHYATLDMSQSVDEKLAVLENARTELIDSYGDAVYLGDKITYSESVDASVDLMTNMSSYKYGLGDYELYLTSKGILKVNVFNKYSNFKEQTTIGVLFRTNYE